MGKSWSRCETHGRKASWVALWERRLRAIDAGLPQAAAGTLDNLLAAMGEAIDTATGANTRGFFAHCGCPIHEPN